MMQAFMIDDLISLAKLGAKKIIADSEIGKCSWIGFFPGPESETWNEIQEALKKKFPDEFICDVS